VLLRRIGTTVSAFFIILWCCSNARALAGTTGGVSGRVVDANTSVAVEGAKVTIVSPAQSAMTTTDAAGRFTFVSLAPDSYTLSIEKDGYEALSFAGISVQADTQQTLPFTMRKTLRTIGRVTTRSNGDLVRPGTTADVYSVNAAQQDRVSALGGGGNLNSAYSAIASVAGAYVPPNQSGYEQTVHIRGGDSDQVGYEFDGIPINRGFDNAPSGSTSSLGQQELQVYTGASPANSEAQGLAGFVNQVIKTGTYPGTEEANVALGTPTFYHSASIELGGANQARTFSYYVALGGFNQDHRYADQFNGSSVSDEFGTVLFTCPSPASIATLPSCFTNGHQNLGQAGSPGYALGPLIYGGGSTATIVNFADRNTVVNLHFGIPHKNGLKDDVQLLYNNDELYSTLASSALDEGLNNVAAFNQYAGAPPGNALHYSDSWQYTGQLGAFLPGNYASLVVPYLFPSSPTNRQFDGNIPFDARDVQLNQQGIVKLQYQKNFSSEAYLRIYGYTYYSNYIGTGPDSSADDGYQTSGYDYGDYELSAHTRGLSATFADQLGSRNLLEAQGSFTTSNALRMYNEQMFNYGDQFAVLVNRNDLTSGTCYALATPGAPVPTTCDPGDTIPVATPPTFATLSAIGCATRGGAYCTYSSGAVPQQVSGLTCGTGPCAYYVVENGQYGEYNVVKPIFTGYSLTDQYKPTDRLSLNLGVRLDNYTFIGADTTGTPARAFWFNAYNKDTCFDATTGQLADKTTLGVPISAACSTAGSAYQPLNLQNASEQRFDYEVLQPRLGATYTVDPNTVLRASYGKYNEQPSSAYQQYSALQQNLPDFLAPEFYAYGFATPGHPVRPSVSYNADFSLEHAFKGTDLSFKLTPFYRKTHDQEENFYLNPTAGLVSGFNIGEQTSEGFEFALNKGDFGRNGFASQLSFAYTNSYVKYSALSNGSSVVSPINGDIETYNSYTSYCAAHAADPKCGGVSASGAPNVTPDGSGSPASPCYSTAGAPVACSAPGAVANPYWNAPPQPLLDPNGNYVPYSIFPAGIGTGANSFEYPYVATLLLNFKHDRFSMTPSLQFEAGNRYGAPETTPGIDPASGCAALTTSTANDPRYPYGAAGGAPYDGATCAGQLNAIPDPYTGKFDAIGAFREPAELLANLRLSYAATKNLEVVATFANIINRCFAGQKTAFTYYESPQVCSYGSLTNFESPVGNVYNPGDNVQTFLRYPYEPSFGSYNDNGSSLIAPFSAYVSLRLKL
jgi:hypothetical protein